MGKQNVFEHVAICKKEFEEKIKMKYNLKMSEIIKTNETKMNIERAQFKMQQDLMKNEIENIRQNFKKQIQILKRFRPHTIVHVPINGQQQNKNMSSYSSQLQQYITENNN